MIAGVPSLELGLVGNAQISALVDQAGRIVWCCLPRFDGDPVFHALLGSRTAGDGEFTIALDGLVRSEQEYLRNTAVLETRLFDGAGNAVAICDFAPRFRDRGRMFRPMSLIRRVRPIAGQPRIQVRLRPRYHWGQLAPRISSGSNHIRYRGPDLDLRLTTTAPLSYVQAATPFVLAQPLSFVLGPDEPLSAGIEDLATRFERNTVSYWQAWSRRLHVPLEWQDAVIRAAITLKLCVFEETGGIIAAATTSIPEAPDTPRTWDYRYCWLRDAFFVVRALNSLAEVGTMEDYLRWLHNVIASADEEHVQPLYGIGLERELPETIVEGLPGYRGMGPVRRGNQAWEHRQHDVYGNIVLGASQAFFDQRLYRPSGRAEFETLERVGALAVRLHDQPDAGMWELRTRSRVHTSSALMCWAACDRLARIATQVGLPERASRWVADADRIKARILSESWNEKRQAFAGSFGGTELDAGVLLMAEVGFLDPRDPRFLATLATLETHLGDGMYMRRYEGPDDFGAPETAFSICSFWRIDALARVGRREEARGIFEAMLAARNHLGLLSEDVHPVTGELWGNFPQTYSMVGIINGATRLSRPWEATV